MKSLTSILLLSLQPQGMESGSEIEHYQHAVHEFSRSLSRLMDWSLVLIGAADHAGVS